MVVGPDVDLPDGEPGRRSTPPRPTTPPSSVTRRAPPARPRAPCCATGTCWPPPSRSAWPGGGAPTTGWSTACPSSTPTACAWASTAPCWPAARPCSSPASTRLRWPTRPDRAPGLPVLRGAHHVPPAGRLGPGRRAAPAPAVRVGFGAAVARAPRRGQRGHRLAGARAVRHDRDADERVQPVRRASAGPAPSASRCPGWRWRSRPRRRDPGAGPERLRRLLGAAGGQRRGLRAGRRRRASLVPHRGPRDRGRTGTWSSGAGRRS